MRLLWFNLATDAEDPILGFTTSWLCAVARRVESIHVITMRIGRVQVPENVHVYSVGKEKGYSEPRRVAEFYRHLCRILAHDRVDGCFCHMIPVFSVLSAPVLKANSIPVVTWFAHPALRPILKLAHRLSTRMVASVATAYPYRHDKLVVLGQGIDIDLFSPGGTIASALPPVILCVGRLSPVKDHATLFRAARLLRERWGKPFRVYVVGGPAGRQDEVCVRLLHQQVKELRLNDIVHFVPQVPMAELPSWYRKCTVHVNLTPTGCGDKVAWEAMSCTRPCVAANEGYHETMGCYADSLLFRHGDADDLAGRLQAVLALSAAERDQMGTYLRDRVVQMHSLDGLAEKIVSLCENLALARR